MDWEVKQFDVLDDFELVGWRELELAQLSLVDLVENLFVNTLGRQRFTQLALVPFLPTSLGFLAMIGFLWRRLHDIAGRRFRGVRRVFHRLGKLEFQVGYAFLQPLDGLRLCVDNPTQIRDNVVLASHLRTIATFSNLRFTNFTRERLRNRDRAQAVQTA